MGGPTPNGHPHLQAGKTYPGQLQETVEAEVIPIELEDDNSHVICPTCFDFIPRAQYPSHRHGDPRHNIGQQLGTK